MNLISWNYRGLGNLRSVNTLEKVVRKEDPKLVFLMETKSDKKNWMDMVKGKCNMKDGLFVSSIGKSGGLALFWKEGVTVMGQTYSQTHIDALVDGGADVKWWHFTGFYGNPDIAKRPESWAKLKYLKGTSTLPWLTIGDFNEITGATEKKGGSDRPRQQMTNFIETINACGLRDLGYNGPKFTWNYERADGVWIRERLDRALATPEWLNLFPLVKLYHLSSSVSDNAPLVLRMAPKPRSTRQKKPFRFESMWLNDQRCEQGVTGVWEKGMFSAEGNVLQNCLEQCRSSLDAWNKKVFGHVGKKVVELQRKVEWLELQPSSTETNQALRSTRSELNSWLDKEDTMWRQ